MSLQYQVYLDGILQETEPDGLAGFELDLTRDDKSHGIGFEASVGPLKFYGKSADYLKNIKDTQGQTANTILKVTRTCEDSDAYETLIDGKLNFSEYKEVCGLVCSVSLPTDSSSCETVLNNRLDQAVDLDKTTAFDGLTGLPDYDGLNQTVELPTQRIDYLTYGRVDISYLQTVDFRSPGGGSKAYVPVRPTLAIYSENITQSNLEGTTLVGYNGPNGIFNPVSAFVLFDESNPQCFSQPFVTNYRMKGSITMPDCDNLDTWLVLFRGEAKNDGEDQFDPGGGAIEYVFLGTLNSPNDYVFDHTFATYNWNPLPNGADGIYGYVYFHQHPGADFHGFVKFDVGTMFSCETVKACPPTQTKGYLVHEALSRVVESVTNGCMRVKSSYYGRTDSAPFNFPSDGCGGKRLITSGIKIRNGTTATCFAAPNDLLNNLQFIDNVGFAVESDPGIAGGFILRIEDLEYFYQNVEIFRALAIPTVNIDIEGQRFYTKITAGYEKWQTNATFGNDEFNSEREYRTGLANVSNPLNIQSKIIAAGKAIEVTREQQYLDSSDADTEYDDNLFIICLARDAGYGYYGGLRVEQGEIEQATNMFSPDTVYNYRISPARNLMRWFKSIMTAYPNIMDSASRIFFSKGTGNFFASGILKNAASDPCVLEAVPVAENKDLYPLMFKDIADATPLYKNETATFDYPMSLSDYIKIKANPYGYVSWQCGNGAIRKGWIKNIKYTPAKGMASIILRRAWTD